MDIETQKRADDITSIYQEMATIFLNVVIDNVAQYMKRKMAEKYSDIEQLILQRLASSYLMNIKEHISRIEALALENDGILGELLNTIESARNDVHMGCFKQLPEKIQLIDAGVADRKRRQIRMGMLERVLLETDIIRMHLVHVFNKIQVLILIIFTTVIINLIDYYLFASI